MQTDLAPASPSGTRPLVDTRTALVRIARTPALRVRVGSLDTVVGVGLAHLLGERAESLQLRATGGCEVELLDAVSTVGELEPLDGTVPVVVLVRVGDTAAAHRARDLGAAAVLTLDDDAGAFEAALHSAARHGRAPRQPRREDGRWDESLSRREADVLAGICAGMSNVEIAAELYLSVNSVKSYIRTTYRKIGTQRRPQAVLWGIEHGYGAGRPAPA